MLNSAIARTVDFCTRYAWVVIGLATLLTVGCGYYAVRHFAINTDINRLISQDLPWRQREIAYQTAFPQSYERVLVVIQAPTPELAAAASKALSDRLSPQNDLFRSIQEPGGGSFFARNGLLFLSTDELTQNMRKLTQAAPLIGVLAGDQNFRGISQALQFILVGVQRNQISLNELAPVLNSAAEAFENVMAGRPAQFSWKIAMKAKPAEPSDLRRFLDIWAILDYGALEPGAKPTEAIRQAVHDLNLESTYGARVRLTGPVPISDEEFGTLKEGALVNGLVTIAVVLVILWLALRSARIILAVFINLITGLAITAALGLWMVGALNPISIAFAVLFVGLGVDFGIQFSVRYRSERHKKKDLRQALISAGRLSGAPLTLAAAATAAGFLSFLPTAYRGLSELGLIAGAGMVIAFITSVTLLPALLKLFNPPGETDALGYKSMAPVDRFMERHRIAVVAATILVAVAGLPLLMYLRFDFNPLNLRSPNAESISTYLELRKDPSSNANTSIQVLAPSLREADALSKRLAAVPEVGRTITLDSFVPDDQPRKLTLVRDAAKQLNPSLRPAAPPKPQPTDAEKVTALNNAAAALTRVAGQDTGPGATAAKRLAADATKLAAGDAALRQKAETVLVQPLALDLDELGQALQADTITPEILPSDLVRDWITRDGRARVDAIPKGNSNDNEVIRNFARAVLAVEPSASGEAIGILESGDTVVRAFIEAGIWALLSITILLWIVLRRFGDVLLTLVPLLLAGAITLEVCVLIGLKLNFANIIALPLLLGVGVAFKIYYVMAWRAGQTGLLQSSLTRAVVFSALTTATAFGSLWFSSHPGTSSMGKLLALSLACTMAAAVLFQPALMGKPRKTK